MIEIRKRNLILALIVMLLSTAGCGATDYWRLLIEEGKLPFYDLTLSKTLDESLDALHKNGLETKVWDDPEDEFQVIVPPDQIFSENMNLDYSLSFFRGSFNAFVKYYIPDVVSSQLIPVFEQKGTLEESRTTKHYTIEDGDFRYSLSISKVSENDVTFSASYTPAQNYLEELSIKRELEDIQRSVDAREAKLKAQEQSSTATGNE